MGRHTTTEDELLDGFLRRREAVEYDFASLVYLYPLYAVQVAAWLSPQSFYVQRLATFWDYVLCNVQPTMSEDEAFGVITQAMSVADVGQHELQSGYGKSIEGLAREIARLGWIASVYQEAGELVKEAFRFDDAAMRARISRWLQRGGWDIKNNGELAGITDLVETQLEHGDLMISTGLRKLDDALGGMPRQELTILAGRPGMGKTSLAWQIVKHAARTYRTVFISLEMSRASLMTREASSRSGILWRDVRAGRVDDTQRTRFLNAMRLAERDLGMLRIFDGNYTSAQIWQAASSTGADLVVIDHLGRISADKQEEYLEERHLLGRITATMQDMAKAMNCAVLLLAQLNRNVENRQDKRPVLSDLRESGKIEENADNVLFIYREGYYTGAIGKQPVEILAKKVRNGPTFECRITFDPAKFEFSDEEYVTWMD
ncbi:AAA family ATPase [Candidatus Parcubacteria bacterium]|nr:MAG: AAA family ATPase [Candidatus Parcubacteria bacterium]